MSDKGDIYFYKDNIYVYSYNYVSMFGESIDVMIDETKNKSKMISLYEYDFWENSKKINEDICDYLSNILENNNGCASVQNIIDNSKMFLNKHIIETVVLYDYKHRFSFSLDKTQISLNNIYKCEGL